MNCNTLFARFILDSKFKYHLVMMISFESIRKLLRMRNFVYLQDSMYNNDTSDFSSDPIKYFNKFLTS